MYTVGSTRGLVKIFFLIITHEICYALSKGFGTETEPRTRRLGTGLSCNHFRTLETG